MEKYRPTNLDDVILDPQIRKQINIILQDRSDVHLIITGCPGIGKTSTVRCIARRVLNESLAQGFLELCAAEDRGIRNISVIIPTFCKKCVDFTTSKIILLDEADNMTIKCQYDINEMIKLYGKKAKFIFTCNDSTKIIEDIQSVCHIIRFKQLTNEQITEFIVKICERENVGYNKRGLETICYISNGDMRKAINNLQLTAFSCGTIDKKNVLTVCKMPDPDKIRHIIDLCFENKLDEINAAVEDIIAEGYYYSDIINCFIFVLSKYEIEEHAKLKLINVVYQTKIIISTGLKSRLQLIAMTCRLIKTCGSIIN